MAETLGLATGVGQAAKRDKFTIQPIKGFDCYLAHRWYLPNSNKASPTLCWQQWGDQSLKTTK